MIVSKRLVYPCLILALGFTWSCSKHDSGPGNGPGQGTGNGTTPTLSLSSTILNAGILAGYSDTFTVSSSVSWKLTITSQGSGWLQLDSMSGSPGKTIIKMTVTGTNTSDTSRTATITVTPVGTTAIQPIQLTIVQKTYKMAWQKALGGSSYEQANAIIRTTDGGYVLAGYTGSNNGDVRGNHGGNDMWVVKLDGSGNKIWQTTLGGTGSDAAYAIIATPDGGYLVAGSTTSSDGDVTLNHGSGDAWVVKLDGNGNLVWQKTFGGTKNDIATAVTSTPDGGYVIAGSTSSYDGDVTTNYGGYDMWVLKLDSKGNKIWQKSLGGAGDDQANSIVASPDGGVVVAGYTNSNDGDVIGNHGDNDMWVVKLDSDGNKIWGKPLGGSSFDVGSAITATPDGGYAIVGITESTNGDVSGNHGNADVWVVKLDGNGSLIWQRCLGGSYSDEGLGITAAPDGGYIIAGITTSTDGDVTGNSGGGAAWLVKLSHGGALMWEKTLGNSGSDEARTIITTPDGGFAAAGDTYDVAGNHGGGDMWIVKLQ